MDPMRSRDLMYKVYFGLCIFLLVLYIVYSYRYYKEWILNSIVNVVDLDVREYRLSSIIGKSLVKDLLTVGQKFIWSILGKVCDSLRITDGDIIIEIDLAIHALNVRSKIPNTSFISLSKFLEKTGLTRERFGLLIRNSGPILDRFHYLILYNENLNGVCVIHGEELEIFQNPEEYSHKNIAALLKSCPCNDLVARFIRIGHKHTIATLVFAYFAIKKGVLRLRDFLNILDKTKPPFDYLRLKQLIKKEGLEGFKKFLIELGVEFKK